MSVWSDSIPPTNSPAGPPTDFLPPAPATLCVPVSPNEPATVAPPSGVSVPGYELLGELGRGGMGVVYKARHQSLNRVVALKVLLGGAFAGPLEKARFRLEAEAVARLHHPNIVQVYDVGEQAGADYIALEFVDGPTLRRWQDGRPIDPKQAAAIVAAVARAVQHAHDAGIVHRDLKPANILLAGVRGQESGVRQEASTSLPVRLTPDSCPLTPEPKVTDFGLAKPIEGGTDLTLTGVPCGTPNYMAPEQVRGGPAGARPAVDVWGVGAVLFELLTGRPPFAGPDGAAIMRDILSAEPSSVRKFAPQVPRDLVVIVAKCLEKNPLRRYLTAGDVAADFERFLAGRPITARPVGPVRRSVRWVRRNPLAASLGSVLAAGLVVTSGFALALAELANRERAAREDEARQRAQADDATRTAEGALRQGESALATARDERDRAEANLATARRAVDHVCEVIDRHQTGDPALYPVFRELLVGFEPFYERFLDQKAGDRGIRADQAAFAHKLGTLEATFGRTRQARTYYLRSAALYQDLLGEQPGDATLRRKRGFSLAMAGVVSTSLREPDADRLLADGLEELQTYAEANRRDAAGLEELIRVRFAAGESHAGEFPETHYTAVLDLLERLEHVTGPTPLIARLRPHALNNIAGILTNRGQTERAESYWVRVLAIREASARSNPDDKLAQYELGKCLSNYANQLGKGGRAGPEFDARKRAAGVFDALRDDTKLRPDYADAIVQNEQNLAAAYARRGEAGRAVERLGRAIEAQALLFARSPDAAPVRGLHADLHTRRAELHDSAGRPDSAARDFREARRLSTKPAHGEYCAARLFVSLVRAGDRAEAQAHAAGLDLDRFVHPFPCAELARGWALLAKAGGDDAAVRNARTAILAARRKGMFADPGEVCRFRSDPEFEPIWDAIPDEGK